jgi:hypothetical protein
MIRLIPISPSLSADDFVRIPIRDPHQLPPRVPFDVCLKQMKEPA